MGCWTENREEAALHSASLAARHCTLRGGGTVMVPGHQEEEERNPVKQAMSAVFQDRE